MLSDKQYKWLCLIAEPFYLKNIHPIIWAERLCTWHGIDAHDYIFCIICNKRLGLVKSTNDIIISLHGLKHIYDYENSN